MACSYNYFIHLKELSDTWAKGEPNVSLTCSITNVSLTMHGMYLQVLCTYIYNIHVYATVKFMA